MNLNFFRQHSLKTRITFFTLAIFVAGVWSLSFYVISMLRGDMERLLGEQQLSAASYVAAEVNSGLADRVKALELIARAIDPALLGDHAALQRFIDQRFVLHSQFNGGVFALSRDGTAIADSPLSTGRRGLNFMDREYAIGAIEQGKATVGRPVVGKALRSQVFSIAVPIRDAHGEVIGALAGTTDLMRPNFLDNVTENRYGETGGYLVVAPQYRLVVTATDKNRVMQPLPAPGVNPDIDRNIAGFEGYTVLVNPLGVEQLAAIKKIPVAGWYLAVALPTEEAFSPIRVMQRRMLAVTLLLTLLTGGLTWWLLRRELSPLLAAVKTLARLSDAAQPRQSLPVVRQDEIGDLIGGFNRLLAILGQREQALNDSETFKQAILDSVAAEIAVLDRDGVIIAVNEPWRRFVLESSASPGKPPPGADVGANYLAGCQAEDGVAEVCDGIRAVLDGCLPDFSFEYRRHAPQRQRWFHMSVTALRKAAQDGVVITHTEITERKLAEEMLVESEARLRAIIENEPECIKIVDAQGRLRQMNAAGLAMIEADSLEQVAGRPVLNVIAPECRAAYAEMHERVIAGESMQLEFEVIGIKGTRRCLETYAVPMQDNGAVVHLAVTRDVTGRKQAEAKLRLAASVFTHAREGIMITEPDGTIIDVNDTFSRITGFERDEVIGCNPRILSSGRQTEAYYAAMWQSLTGTGHWYGEVWNRRKNGEIYAEMQTISAVRDAQGNIRQYVALFSDITAQKEYEQQLEHIAHYDALTGLPNRVLLADRLHQGMTQSQRRGQPLAVAYLDLDGFKAVNDIHGHDAGDQLLMVVATRMKRALREGDTLARLGGDEFVAVLLDLADAEASIPLLARLLAAAAEPVEIAALTLRVSASLGVTFYPQPGNVDADQLLRQADQAMYQAKLAGKNRYHIFDADHDSNIRLRHESLERIRRALAEREFVLYYQPKVNMRSGAVIGAEALIRWQHPEEGLLPPGVFLPVIEDHPLAVELGEWVIDTALTQMTLWRQAGLDIPVSVNVSAFQLQQSGFVSSLRALLAAHPGVEPNRLEIEVLETSALEDIVRVSQVMKACRELGVSFALDDFGTGYSSLTYLKRLPASTLKIDQSFVRDMLDDPEDLAILHGVLGLAAAFRRDVIAEGVESLESGAMLLQLGCELAQGYGIARPMPAHEMPAWSASWRTDSVWADMRRISRDDLPVLFVGVEHRAWVVAVEAFLKGERDTAPLLDPHQCRFGKWLNVEGSSRYRGLAALADIDALHREVHELAAYLTGLHLHGRSEEALAELGRLRGLRDALLARLKSLLRAD